MLGNYNEAASLFRQSVELNRKIGDIGMVVAELTNLGFVEVHLGNTDSAERSFNGAEKLAPKLTDPYSQAMSLLTKRAVAFLKGDHGLSTISSGTVGEGSERIRTQAWTR